MALEVTLRTGGIGSRARAVTSGEEAEEEDIFVLRFWNCDFISETKFN
jgi:hypothetical protein